MGAVVEPEIVHGSGRQPLNENGLTMKQQRFVDAYLVTFNATEAARRAGYQGNDVTLGQVGAENLKKPQIVSLLSKRVAQIHKKAEKEIIDVYEEFREHLVFLRKLKAAAEVWLADPDDPELFTLAPRSDEIDVVYTVFGNKGPVQKTESLAVLLERIEDRYPDPTPFVKTVDMREYALKVIDRCDMTIDKFARMGGAYQKDRQNERDPAQLMEDLVNFLVSKGHDRAVAIETARKKYATSPLQLNS